MDLQTNDILTAEVGRRIFDAVLTLDEDALRAEFARARDEHGGAEQQPDVGDPGDEEGGVRCAPGLGTTGPVPDEQPRAPAHDLPADDGEQQVGGEDDEDHRRAEERHGRVEAAAPVVVGEVPRGVDLHERGDEGDDEDEEGARR